MGQQPGGDGGEDHERDDQHGAGGVEGRGGAERHQGHERGVQAAAAYCLDAAELGIEGASRQPRESHGDKGGVDDKHGQHDPEVVRVGENRQVEITHQHSVHVQVDVAHLGRNQDGAEGEEGGEYQA